MKKLFCCPSLEIFCCLLLRKTLLLSSSRVFLVVYLHFFVFYPYGKQCGYLEKSNKMQQKLEQLDVPIKRSVQPSIKHLTSCKIQEKFFTFGFKNIVRGMIFSTLIFHNFRSDPYFDFLQNVEGISFLSAMPIHGM